MFYLFPFVAAFVYWLLFFLSITIPDQIPVLFLILLAWFIGTIAYIGRLRWYLYWQLFINYTLFVFSSFTMLLVLSNATLRNVYTVFAGLLIGLLCYVYYRYIRDKHIFSVKIYLEFVGFVYLITLWQLFTIVYFMLISFNASLLYAICTIIPVTYIIARGIIGMHSLKKSSERLVISVITLTTVEFFYVLQLLPLHYYVLGTLLTVWFFFVMEMVLEGQQLASRRRIFSRYTLFMAIAMLLLFVTSQWR